MISGRAHDTCLKQIELPATVHLTPDEFQLRDLASVWPFDHIAITSRFISLPGAGYLRALSFKAAVDDPALLESSRIVGGHFDYHRDACNLVKKIPASTLPKTGPQGQFFSEIRRWIGRLRAYSNKRLFLVACSAVLENPVNSVG